MPHIEVLVNSDAVVESLSQSSGFAPLSLPVIIEHQLVPDLPKMLADDGGISGIDPSKYGAECRTLGDGNRAGSNMQVRIRYEGVCPSSALPSMVKVYMSEALKDWFYYHNYTWPEDTDISVGWGVA
jgi:hypothetical protein